MNLADLLESGAGAVHDFSRRVAGAYRAGRGAPLRLAIALTLFMGAVLLAERIGLAAPIASGYRALAGVIFVVVVAPLLSLGVWKLWKQEGRDAAAHEA